MPIREPAVAGLFYPAGEDRLRREVRALLAAAGSADASSLPKVLIVPHAGYEYSGPVAARAYRLLEPAREVVRRVVLLGPAHRVHLDGMAIPSVDAFRTPLGEVPLERETLAALSGLRDVQVSDRAHEDEHSLEVQLPFLQAALTRFSLVPVAVGRCPPESLAAVLDAAWGGEETLIVVSSDLSHYLSYEQAVAADRRTVERILDKAGGLSGEDACGADAINGLMRAARCEDLSIKLLDLRNSGDTAGDRSRVVGYAAFALH